MRIPPRHTSIPMSRSQPPIIHPASRSRPDAAPAGRWIHSGVRIVNFGLVTASPFPTTVSSTTHAGERFLVGLFAHLRTAVTLEERPGLRLSSGRKRPGSGQTMPAWVMRRSAPASTSARPSRATRRHDQEPDDNRRRRVYRERHPAIAPSRRERVLTLAAARTIRETPAGALAVSAGNKNQVGSIRQRTEEPDSGLIHRGSSGISERGRRPGLIDGLRRKYRGYDSAGAPRRPDWLSAPAKLAPEDAITVIRSAANMASAHAPANGPAH
jgi:hypothetical protein